MPSLFALVGSWFMEDSFMLVMMTAPSESEGAELGRKVVAEGLAACCNILPGVRSIYIWQGKIMDEPEVLCIMKTRAVLFDKLKVRLSSLHSYEVPEIIGFNIDSGLAEYFKWIEESTES